MKPGITVVIPTIPVRQSMLDRAVASTIGAAEELYRRAGGVVASPYPVYDFDRQGAATTRHRGLLGVQTEWVAFLDDDDVMHRRHLVELYTAAIEHGADFLWSRFQIKLPDGATVQGPQFLGAKAFEQWRDDDPCQTTITTLVRTELAQAAGGFLTGGVMPGLDEFGNRVGEDHQFALRCRKAGAVMRHVPEVTWDWWHHGGNTSGLPVW